jgi:hypothetical protein
MRPVAVAVTLCCLVAVAACSSLPPPTEPRAERRAEPPADLPASRRPTPAPIAEPPAATPFEVVLAHIEMVSMSHGEIVGAGAGPPDEDAVALAADRARRVLQRYLDTQFVDAETRFTTAALHELLTDRAQAALTPADRLALGAVHYRGVWTKTGPATARATVLYDGAAVELVTLEYEARAEVGYVRSTRTRPLTQQGTLVYVPTAEGWRVEAADVTLDAPDPPPSPTRP